MEVLRAITATVIITAMLAGPVSAQEPSRFAWAPSHQDEARSLSDAAIGGQAGIYAKHVWDAPDRKRALSCAAMRVGITVAATEIVKRVVHRTRPDGSDDRSFWSGHSATSMAMAGWDYRVGIPLSISTGYLRVAAKRHYWSDVAAGFGAGAFANLICHGNDGYGVKQ